MATITPDTEVRELSIVNAKNLPLLNTQKIEDLYDIKAELSNEKLILVGEKDNVEKAKSYAISLLRPSECVCQIYDCMPENVKFLEMNLSRVQKHSGCYVKQGEDSYFLVYGVEQEDVCVAISLLDKLIEDKTNKLFSPFDNSEYFVVLSDVSMGSSDESVDLIADDNDDEGDDTHPDSENNSLEVSQMMSDIVLESQGGSPNAPGSHNETIDLRSDDNDDDEEECIIISDSPTPIKKKKKRKKNKKKTQTIPGEQPSTSSSISQVNPSPSSFGNKLDVKPNPTCRKQTQPALVEIRNNHPNIPNVRPPLGMIGPRNPRFQHRFNVTQNDIMQMNPFVHPQFHFPQWQQPQAWPPFTQPNPFPPFRTGLRKIVIDGSNIAMMHGIGRVFSCRGIGLVVDYFEKRGHKEIAVFVPQWRRSRKNPVSDPEVMERLYSSKKLFFTPSREVDGKIISSYDDRFILKEATDEGGIVVSNDQYKDLYAMEPCFRETIEKRILQVTFVGDKVMFPDDPLGRNGPSLDEFLCHSPPQQRIPNAPRADVAGSDSLAGDLDELASAANVSNGTGTQSAENRARGARTANRIKRRARKRKIRDLEMPISFVQTRHRSPSAASRIQQQQHNKKSRSSSCRALKKALRSAIPPNHRPNSGKRSNNPVWQRPPFNIALRSTQVTENLRRSLNSLPYSNPQKVDKVLKDHPSVVDLNFLQALL